MTPVAPHITAFFQERLTLERRASTHTCDSYAYAFQLLLTYASTRVKLSPSRLQFEQIDAPLVVSFLNDLEATRSNGASSRNVRLAAIKSFMHFMEYRVPPGSEADSTHSRYSDEEDGYAFGAPPLDRRGAGSLGRTQAHRLGRHSGPCHAAFVFCCRAARLRTDGYST
jgi:hypothetical protein